MPIRRQHQNYRRIGTIPVCVQLQFVVDFDFPIYSFRDSEYDICLPGFWDRFFF